jgi:hypothetical protein
MGVSVYFKIDSSNSLSPLYLGRNGMSIVFPYWKARKPITPLPPPLLRQPEFWKFFSLLHLELCPHPQSRHDVSSVEKCTRVQESCLLGSGFAKFKKCPHRRRKELPGHALSSSSVDGDVTTRHMNILRSRHLERVDAMNALLLREAGYASQGFSGICIRNRSGLRHGQRGAASAVECRDKLSSANVHLSEQDTC